MNGTARPLEGITCGVKDEHHDEGWIVTMGSNLFKDDCMDHGELFYRVELTPRLTVTPNVQTVIEPAAESNNVIEVFGIRGRFAM